MPESGKMQDCHVLSIGRRANEQGELNESMTGCDMRGRTKHRAYIGMKIIVHHVVGELEILHEVAERKRTKMDAKPRVKRTLP